MRTLVMGDIHGRFEALKQCLSRAGYNPDSERLIVLGDVCDRGKQVKDCIDLLLTFPHCDYIIGNHDQWTLRWATDPDWEDKDIWKKQGGKETMASYKKKKMPLEHVNFLKRARPYIEEGKNCYVHGGFNHEKAIVDQRVDVLAWDRDLVYKASQQHQIDSSMKFGGYDKIFVGHTPTLKFNSEKPLQFCNLWLLDTGAGWSKGRLTAMDPHNHSYWQSDPVK